MNAADAMHLVGLCGPAGFAAALLGYGLLRMYLGSGEADDGAPPAARESVPIRAFRILLGPLADHFRRREPVAGFVRDNLRNYRQDLLASGRFWGGLDAAEILAARFVLPLVLALVLVVIGELGGFPADLVLLVALAFAALGFLYPGSALRDAAAHRRALFMRQLPGGLDILKIAAESGLDFHASVNYLVQIYLPGPVRDEMRLFQREFQLGTPTAEALLNVSRRIGAPEAATVFTSLAQAIEMGTSVSEMLAATAGEMRRKRLLSAEAEAQKAVVKITFPLLLLILPGIFIVLLAPIAKPMMDAFSGM